MQNNIYILFTIAFFALATYIAVVDKRTGLINGKHSIALYALSLAIAVITGLTPMKIIIYSAWLSLLFIGIFLAYSTIAGQAALEIQKDIGGGDIKLAPAITLFNGSFGLFSMGISLAVALIIERLINKKDEFPLAPYLLLSSVISVMLKFII